LPQEPPESAAEVRVFRIILLIREVGAERARERFPPVEEEPTQIGRTNPNQPSNFQDSA
jgi:hypothetical protein